MGYNEEALSARFFLPHLPQPLKQTQVKRIRDCEKQILEVELFGATKTWTENQLAEREMRNAVAWSPLTGQDEVILLYKQNKLEADETLEVPLVGER